VARERRRCAASHFRSAKSDSRPRTTTPEQTTDGGKRVRLNPVVIQLAVLCLLDSPTLSSQSTRHSSQPVVLPGEYLRVTSFQPLAPGNFLVLDAAVREVFTISTSRGTNALTARKGSGPKELQRPVGLLPMKGGGARVTDLASLRWLEVSPQGEPIGVTNLNGMMSRVLGGTLWGGDTLGCLYSSPKVSATSPDAYELRAPLLRWCESSTPPDTIAFVRLPANEWSATRTVGAGLLRSSTSRPMFAKDQVTVCKDGTVYVLRATDGAIDRYARGVRSSSKLPVVQRIKIDAAEKRAFRQSQVIAGSIQLVGVGTRNPRPRPAAGISGLTDESDPPGTIWPLLKPHVLRPAIADPFGALWIQRVVPASDSMSSIVDVLARDLRTHRVVRLPERATLLGVDGEHVYVLKKDIDGFERIFALDAKTVDARRGKP